MANIDLALNKINKTKKLEEKLCNFYQNFNTLPQEAQEALSKIGVDMYFAQELYSQIVGIRQFYEHDLGAKEIECDWI